MTRCDATTAAGQPCRAWAVEGSTKCIAHVGVVRRRAGLTPEIADRIASVVRSGSYMGVAISATGIARQTFYEWWKRGDPTGDAPVDEPFREMRRKVERARAEGEARNVAIIAAAAQENWQAAAWMLERSYPERWARVSQRADDGKSEAPVPAPADPFAEVDELAARRRHG